MVTIEREASTLDESQLPYITQIQHPGYCYFVVQANPQIAAQSTGPFLAEKHSNYFICDIKETAAVFFTSGFGQQESLLQPNQLYGKICDEFYTILGPTQIHAYPEILDRISTYHVVPISTGDLQLEQSVINLFDAYRHEEFDTDIVYEFTNNLDMFVQANGKSAVLIINSLIKKQALEDDLVSETLKALGRIEHDNTKEQRYEVLMGFITHDSPIIRDGAVSGLSFLDDKRALPRLRMLCEAETVPILKNNIKTAIKGFESH